MAKKSWVKIAGFVSTAALAVVTFVSGLVDDMKMEEMIEEKVAEALAEKSEENEES